MEARRSEREPATPGLMVLLETTTAQRSGRERGLGRYVTACRRACDSLGHAVIELQLRKRQGRTAELRDIAVRALRTRKGNPDLFHITHPGVWGPARMPTVASILDVAPLDLDAFYGRTGLKTRMLFERAAKSDVVLTLSEFSRGRIIERLGVDEGRVVVAPLFPAPVFGAAAGSRFRSDRRRPCVVTVVDMATPDPRKRADWVGPIAKRLRDAGVDLKVIGAGSDGGGVTDYAEGLGRLSDEEMAEHFADASCFLYFSAYEGQGLPPLEAMAAGAPVVAVENTAVSEVVGGAGVLVPEQAPDWESRLCDDAHGHAVQGELIEACLSLVGDAAMGAEYGERSRRRAALYTERRFCDGIDRAYKLAMGPAEA